MSRVLNAKEICERALRLIGKFPTTESAPDGEDLREALHWLDLILAEVSGTARLFFLISTDHLRIDLEGETSSYELADVDGYPTDGIQFPVGAWLEDSEGNRQELTIVARDNWQNQANIEASGTPAIVYIDRLPEPTLFVAPVPPEDDVWTLVLDYQTYAPNVAPGGVSGNRPQGNTEHEFRQAWQRWMVYKLAIDIGGGAVIKLPEQSLTRFEREARIARDALDAFENRQHDTEPPIAEPYGYDDECVEPY